MRINRYVRTKTGGGCRTDSQPSPGVESTPVIGRRFPTPGHGDREQPMHNRSEPTIDARTDSCPECGGRIVHRRDGVCRDCGLVVGSRIDSRPRRGRPRSRDGGRATGAPLSLTRPDRRLSTRIGQRGRDARGNRIHTGKRRRLRRQRVQNQRAAREAHKQTLQPGLREVARVCTAVNVGAHVRETASVVFRQALDEHLLYGRAYESIASASTYLGVRTVGVVRTLSEIQTASKCPDGHVARDVRFLQRELDLAVEPPDVRAYLSRLRSTLGVDEGLTRKARALLDAAVEANLHSGRDPQGLAGGALYTASLLAESHADLCQTEVAEVADLSAETIRARHEELRPLCPEVFGFDVTEIESPSSRAGERRGTAN
ncbi:MAG: transcription initiation factor IIB family protein [Halapricum sp.]